MEGRNQLAIGHDFENIRDTDHNHSASLSFTSKRICMCLKTITMNSVIT